MCKITHRQYTDFREVFVAANLFQILPLLFGLGIASWMVHEMNQETYYTDIARITEKAIGPINARIDSWT